MIIGVLSWFEESPSWLSACVASMARVCDHVVAVDGRYAHFDHQLNSSPVEQCEAIVETAAGAGLALTLHRPVSPFYGNEVEKRNLTLKLAGCVATPMKDWLLVLDGDCYITEHSPFLRRDLDETDHLTAQIAVQETMDPHDPDMPFDIGRTVQIPNTTLSPVTLLYRFLDAMEYKGTHYSLGGYVDDKWTWLWGADHAVTPADMSGNLTIRHRNTQRMDHRRRQAASYYEKRDALNLEVRPSR